MKPIQRPALTLSALLTLLIILAAGCLPAAVEPAPFGGPASVPDGERARVNWVTDGDTIEVEINGREYDVRYIGIDTPERDEPFYREATNLNIDLVKNETVILVRDVSDTDQYGRLLRYVYLPDGTFVNAEMISQGMARLVTFPPDVAQTNYFKSLQEEARNERRGMWAEPGLVGPCDCDRNLYDCRDFDRQSEAQICFDYCMDTEGRDIHNLDGGGDGLVCESLP